MTNKQIFKFDEYLAGSNTKLGRPIKCSVVFQTYNSKTRKVNTVYTGGNRTYSSMVLNFDKCVELGKKFFKQLHTHIIAVPAEDDTYHVIVTEYDIPLIECDDTSLDVIDEE